MNLPLPLELELATIHLVTLIAGVTAESPDHVALEISYCTRTLVLFPADFSLQVWPCKTTGTHHLSVPYVHRISNCSSDCSGHPRPVHSDGAGVHRHHAHHHHTLL